MAAGCGTQIVAGELPQDAAPPSCDAATSCNELCVRCADGAADCDERVFGVCGLSGTCDLRAPVCGFVSKPPRRPPPDDGCLGRHCSDHCVPTCDDAGCEDAGPEPFCNAEGVCSGAVPSCGIP